MDFAGWTQEDFAVFSTEGFEERMAAIRARIQPKLEAFGTDLVDLLAADTGTEWFHHVAKHLRRSVNPPADTWVALNRAKKGYKATVHFGVGISAIGANVCLVVKPECVEREAFARAIEQGVGVIRPLLAAAGPLYFGNVPTASYDDLLSVKEATAEEWLHRADWLRTHKMYEFEMGTRFDTAAAIALGGKGLLESTLRGIREMLPLYNASVRLI
jgi:uncharacterized protein YktB (UPF0637 family)